MNTAFWPVVGLAVCDGILLVLCYLGLRAYAPVNRSILLPVAAGLSGFVFHAFMFSQGAFLILQLATIAGLFGLCLFVSRKPHKS